MFHKYEDDYSGDRITNDVQTQDEMSEILGLGTKTYHKWESGDQFSNLKRGHVAMAAGNYSTADESYGKFWVNNHAHILKPRWGGDETFFVNLLESQDFSLFVTGAAQPKLTMENLGRFKLALPRVVEQKEIATFIRAKDAEFRPLFAQIERQIETLEAYRRSLIHECVTGQRWITEAEVVRNQLSENIG